MNPLGFGLLLSLCIVAYNAFSEPRAEMSVIAAQPAAEVSEYVLLHRARNYVIAPAHPDPAWCPAGR
jgi:hypothetical protein